MHWVATLLLAFGLASSALADGRVGIVVMHGKWGNPTTVSSFANRMERAGHRVENIEMPWSGRRSYDAGVEGFVAEIDAAFERLREKGASKFILAGHSLGAAGGLHYVTRRKIDGLIAIAPGHSPERGRLLAMFANSVARAREMVARGEGNEKGWFDDFNTGNRTKQVRMTAQTYLDFFAPDGPMNFTGNVAKIQPGTHVLWVAPTREEAGLKSLTAAALPLIPAGVTVVTVTPDADHMSAPDVVVDAALQWIAQLAR
ncbi:MAG: alpha/beta fold hydrolase [Hylemonella sp.]